MTLFSKDTRRAKIEQWLTAEQAEWVLRKDERGLTTFRLNDDARRNRDFCTVHGSRRDGSCPCEENAAPSKTITRRQTIHFAVFSADGTPLTFGCSACSMVVYDSTRTRTPLTGRWAGCEYVPLTSTLERITCQLCRSMIEKAAKAA